MSITTYRHQPMSAAAAVNFISRKLIFKGQEEEIPEENLKWIEKKIKNTGETLEEATERLYMEYRQGDYDKMNKVRTAAGKKPNPNTLDYYLLKI
jgi:hypothetical protein